MTRNEFIAAMAPLAVNYNRELTKPLMLTYWAEFQHILPDEFRDAVMYHIRTGKFFPTIADLRHALGLTVTTIATLTDAATTFEALLGTAPAYDPRHGDYWTLEAVQEQFGAVALAAFMAAGGTRVFRDRTDRDLPFLRKEFLRAWEEAAKALEPLPALPRSTPGTTRGLAPISEAVKRLAPPIEQGDAFEEPTVTEGE